MAYVFYQNTIAAATCGSRKGESLDSIADFDTMHDPRVYGSPNPFSARVAHVLPSNAAVAAAGDCGSTPSALSNEGNFMESSQFFQHLKFLYSSP